jgi:hypothetical protein
VRSGLLQARVFVVLFGVAMLAAYTQLVTLVPNAITGGILDGARNLAEGRGLVTHSVNPVFLPYFRDLTLPLPYPWYPMLPIVTSWVFRLFGVHPWGILVLPMGSYLLAGLLTFEVGRRVFDARTGVFAALLLLTDTFMLETSTRVNFTDPILVALVLLGVLAILRASDEGQSAQVRWLIVAGVSLGLAQYARSAALMLYLPMTVLVVALSSEKRMQRFLIFAASCFVVQLPLYIWNAVHLGHPIFTPTYVFLSLTRSFPGLSAFAMLPPTSFGEILKLYGGEIAVKWLSQVWVHAKYFFTFTTPVVLTAAVLSFALPLDRRQRALRTFTAVLYICLVVLNSLFYWDNRYLLPVLPFVALLGFDLLRRILAAATLTRAARWSIVAALAVLVSLDRVDFFFQMSKTPARQLSAARRLDNRERARFVMATLRPTDIVMTPDPGLVAWETGNTAIGLPRNLEIAKTIHDRFVPFNVLLLEARLPRADLFSYARDWEQVAQGEQTFLGFTRQQSIALSGGQTLILLRSSDSADQQR